MREFAICLLAYVAYTGMEFWREWRLDKERREALKPKAKVIVVPPGGSSGIYNCKVVFECGGAVHEVLRVPTGLHPPVDLLEARLVCDVLSVKEAVDAERPLEELHLHTGQRLDSSSLDVTARSRLRRASVTDVYMQLKACTADRRGGSMPGSAGRRLLEAAASLGHEDALSLLMLLVPAQAAVADGSLLHLAAGGGHVGVVPQLLAAAPAAALAANTSGLIPLHIAAGYGHTSVVQALLQAAPSAATARTRSGRTPLHFAVGNGHDEVIQELLAAASGAATGADADGNTPLHLAARQDHPAAVQLLLAAAPAAGAASNAEGQTPLQVAVRHRSPAAARCLVGVGPADTVCMLTTLFYHNIAHHLDDVIADFVVARLPLTDAAWARVPKPCRGLGRALPAALAHSPQQVQQVMRRLEPQDKQRLRVFALCLVRVQGELNTPLPAAVLGQILALFAD